MDLKSFYAVHGDLGFRRKPKEPLLAASLFSSGGIGDLALRAAGGTAIIANELLPERAALYQYNYPESVMLTGDIRELGSRFVECARQLLADRELDVLLATPPCQGMSKNGRGKLLSEIRAGRKPKLDKRNQLIVEAVSIVEALKPRTVIFENVPEMETTLIEIDGAYLGVMDFLRSRLEPMYVGSWAVVEFANYGVPQRRQRLITVFSRDKRLAARLKIGPEAWLAPCTHAKASSMFLQPWNTVMDAIGHLPPLDAKDERSAASDIPFHRVPVLDSDKYFWVSNTPPNGYGAFDNQCVNPLCGFQGNATHGASHNAQGINRSHRTTPIRCLICDELLPRPWMCEGGDYRLMAGFTSAYKRMRGDLPASALTRNLSYACSDQKLHPTQNRVLSIYEALIIHTVEEHSYQWRRADGRRVPDKTVREIIGESIPPRGLEAILRHLFADLESRYAARLGDHFPAVAPFEEPDVAYVV